MADISMTTALALRLLNSLSSLWRPNHGFIAEVSAGVDPGVQIFGYKAGIGTASRSTGTICLAHPASVPVKAGYGQRRQLISWCGGSVCTDPVVKGRAQWLGLGLVRTGSVDNDISGEILLAFSTVLQIPKKQTGRVWGTYQSGGPVWVEEGLHSMRCIWRQPSLTGISMNSQGFPGT